MTKIASPFSRGLRTELGVAMHAADMARKIALRYWRSGSARLQIKTKSNPRDIVTQADLTIDRTLQKFLRHKFPHYQILSEETADDHSNCNPARTNALWVLDPIDGTSNFSVGEPIFGVSIGLLHYGQPVLGVIDFPAINERYWAAASTAGTNTKSRAFVKWRQQPTGVCHVSSVSRLEQARCSFGGADSPQVRRKHFKHYSKILNKTYLMQNNRCAVFDFANVIRGDLDFYLCYGIKLWDLAAAWCILRAAGGEIAHTNSQRHTIFDSSYNEIVAGNPKIIRAVQNFLTKL